MMATVPSLDSTFLAAFRAGTLTPAQADATLPRDRAAVIFLLLQLSAAMAGGSTTPDQGAHTPSGSLPPYAKPKSGQRRKKRGGQNGHPGHARQQPKCIEEPSDCLRLDTGSNKWEQSVGEREADS